MPLRDLLDDHDLLLSLEPEEVGLSILQDLAGWNRNDRGDLHRGNYLMGMVPEEDGMLALAEAWSWLEREGLIASEARHGGERDWIFITRHGHKVLESGDVEQFGRASLLKKDVLHPNIAERAWNQFIRGEYDTAVLTAFRQVEISVRTAANEPAESIGVQLMRKAFKPEDGPLSDQTQPESQRQALAHLFAGALGYYKNPASHSDVRITDPSEAVEMILLASHLLRIVESRIEDESSNP